MAAKHADSSYNNRLYQKRQELNIYNRMGLVTMGTVQALQTTVYVQEKLCSFKEVKEARKAFQKMTK